MSNLTKNTGTRARLELQYRGWDGISSSCTGPTSVDTSRPGICISGGSGASIWIEFGIEQTERRNDMNIAEYRILKEFLDFQHVLRESKL